MAYQKTAKDRAFDRERMKFKRQIHAKDEEIRKYIIEIRAKESIIEHYEKLLEEAGAENKRLKELIDMPREQLEELLKTESERLQTSRKCSSAIEAMLRLGSYSV